MMRCVARVTVSLKLVVVVDACAFLISPHGDGSGNMDICLKSCNRAASMLVDREVSPGFFLERVSSSHKFKENIPGGIDDALPPRNRNS